MMINLTGEIVILTGPPGSGKTTTAQAFAGKPGSPKVHVHADDFWRFIKTGAVAPNLPEAHAQNRVVAEILARVAEGYAEGGYLVIMDGIIGPWFLQPFKVLAVPLHYIVLRTPLDAAIARCRRRDGDTLTVPEDITALYQQFSSLGELERHVLRTEGHSPQETLNKVIGALLSGAFCLSS